MTIADKKKEMLKYRDFYGGDLLGVDEINNAKTNEDLKKILTAHAGFLEDQLCDATSHLESFEKTLGLF